MNKHFIILLAAMAITTYLVRMIPFVLFRSQIKSKFVRDFLYYIPYSVLGAMTVPYMFYAGADMLTSCVGFVTAFIMAYKRFSLISVAGAACVAAYAAGLIIKFI